MSETASTTTGSGATGAATTNTKAVSDMLTRVLDRLGSVNDERLKNIAPKLLPSILPHLSTSDPAVRAKAVAVLSHLSKRVRPNREIPLPALPLLALAVDGRPSVSPFTRNFAAAFLEMAAGRLPSAAARGELGASLLGALGGSAVPAFGSADMTL